ncbi:MAG: DMT family transporter [Blautia sp.]|nr:DMT family transporter [Blautia sp.]
MRANNSMRSSLLLLITATIWGVAFVAQSVGMEYVGGFTFNSVRSLIGAAVLFPVMLFLEKRKTPAEKAAGQTEKNRRTLWSGGLICGIFLCAASNCQQFGIKYTTVGKAGFITALYIVLVPILGIFLRKKCSALVWAAVALALIGLYLLCMKGDSLSLGKGEFLLILCAFLFAMQILAVDHFSPLTSGVKLSMIQFLVCGIGSGIPMLLFEHPQLSQILAAWKPILYAGIMSCGVAYTLQIIGQKDLNPTIASLIMSLESCISVIAGWLILGQAMSLRELTGCIVMFLAIILAQLPPPKKNKK